LIKKNEHTPSKTDRHGMFMGLSRKVCLVN